MSLTREQVEKVSLLARLRLSPDELALMTAHLSAIVGYVGQLAELDTEGIEPMPHALPIANVLADDVVAPSLDRESALATAPKHDDECYLVPPVLG